MLPYEFYKIVHIAGILMLFSGLCALWGVCFAGQPPRKNVRLMLAVIHGLGMAFVLVGGFGMMARLGIINGMPGWIVAKFCIWLLLGASMVLAKRRAQWGPSLICLWIFMGATAGWLAIYKPF